MFNWNPMIVGTLIDEKHPAFADFPTNQYADWQWWDILNHATAMEMTPLRQLTPVIQSIDTYEVNEKLGIAFEANVGKGRLFVLCVDPSKDIANRPATRQLMHSVKAYVASDARFRPKCSLKAYEVDALFDATKQQNADKGDNAAVKQLLNQ